MIVTCASCLTKFNLNESRIPIDGAKVRCSRCKHVFYVVLPPEKREEVLGDFESFAKYHEDLGGPVETQEDLSVAPQNDEAEVVSEEASEETFGDEEVEEGAVEKALEEALGTPVTQKVRQGQEIDIDRKTAAKLVEKAGKTTFNSAGEASQDPYKNWPSMDKVEKWAPPEVFVKSSLPEQPEEYLSSQKVEAYTPLRQEEQYVFPERIEPDRAEKPNKKKKKKSSKAKSRLSPFKKRPSREVLLLIIFGILAFGIYYLWMEMSSGGKFYSTVNRSFNNFILTWNQISGGEKRDLIAGNFSGYHQQIKGLSLYVIEGKIKNNSLFDKKYIKLEVVILDQDNHEMAQKTTICGRSLSPEELKEQSDQFFKGEMTVDPQTPKEMIAPSGKTIPFMVIFKDPPARAKFGVDILEAPNL